MPTERMERGEAERRTFLRTIAWGAGGLAVSGFARAFASPPDDAHEQGAEVTPGEDLMQEHGVLERVLLVYGEASTRIERGDGSVDLSIVRDAARLVRRFIEDYHGRLEEEEVFPRLERAGVETDLVSVLKVQHRRGRDLTDAILRSADRALREHRRRELASTMRSFERMYRPHAAREDTVLFPAFRRLFSASAYRELGDRFEEREHALLGGGGFTAAVAEAARLERALGIHDLRGFTA